MDIPILFPPERVVFGNVKFLNFAEKEKYAGTK